VIRSLVLKMMKREVDRPFLVEDELNRIIDKAFSVSRMAQVRDIFVPALEILERYKDHPQCLNEGRLLPMLAASLLLPLGAQQLNTLIGMHFRYQATFGAAD
jgi:hypothetical protein